MKRITLLGAFGVAALALAFQSNASAAPVAPTAAVVAGGHEGDSCDLAMSRGAMSGYLVSTGRAAPEDLECRSAAQ